MQSVHAVKSGFKQAADFSSVASRADFWGFALFVIAGFAAMHFLDRIIFGGHLSAAGPLVILFGLVVTVPFLAMGARRLHAVGKTGWWQIIPFNLIVLAKLLSNYIRVEDKSGSWTDWLVPISLGAIALTGICIQALIMTWYAEAAQKSDEPVTVAVPEAPHPLDMQAQDMPTPEFVSPQTAHYGM